MYIKVGGLTIKVELEEAELKKLIELTKSSKVTNNDEPSQTLIEEETIDSDSELEDLDLSTKHEVSLIRDSGMTLHSMVMVTKKLLHVETTSKRIGDDYKRIRAKAGEWLTRPIRDTFQILYISPVRIPFAGEGISVIGLNTENQLIVLAIQAGADAASIFKKLQTRGLRTNSVKLVVLGLSEKLENVVVDTFSSAKVQRCWTSVERATPASLRHVVKELSLETSENGVRAKFKQLAKMNPDIREYIEPYLNELTTYFSFDKKLWRVLKSLAPSLRLESEFTRRTRKAGSLKDSQLLLVWITLRLQFHWLKIPVDSPQLSNLRYIKERESGDLGERKVSTQKGLIRRRPSERPSQS